MPESPEWIRKAKERAEAATKGLRMIGPGSCHARMDVPRLLELVEEMATELQTVRELLPMAREAASTLICGPLFTETEDAQARIDALLAKYRGEAGGDG